MALSTQSPEPPRPPSDTEERPRPLSGPFSGPLSGAWWDTTRQTAADAAAHSDDLTERTSSSPWRSSSVESAPSTSSST